MAKDKTPTVDELTEDTAPETKTPARVSLKVPAPAPVNPFIELQTQMHAVPNYDNATIQRFMLEMVDKLAGVEITVQ